MRLKGALAALGLSWLMLQASNWAVLPAWDVTDYLDRPPAYCGAAQCTIKFLTPRIGNEVILNAKEERIVPGRELLDFWGYLYPTDAGWGVISDRTCERFIMEAIPRFDDQTWFQAGRAVRVRARYDTDAPPAVAAQGTPILVTDIMPIW